MRIDAAGPGLRLQLPRETLAALPKLGAQLLARVEIRDGQVSLRLGGELLPVKTQLPLQHGEVLQLEVAELEPQLVLKAVARPPERDALLQMALRMLLPRPGATASAGQTVAMLTDLPPESLPPKAAEALRQLVQALPRAAELADPKGLELALRRSGLFLENTLARGSDAAAPIRDLKSLLLRLTAPASPGTSPEQPTPVKPEETLPLQRVLAGAEAALNRIGMLQVQAAEHGSGPLDLLFELPVLGETRVEPLSIRIEQEDASARDHPQGAPALKVRLLFALEGLGEVSASVRLAGEQVSVFWAAREASTAALIAEHLDHLETRLRALGLEVSQLDCREGAPATVETLPQRPWKLIDEKA